MEVSQYETNKNSKGAHALVLSEDGMHRIAFWLRILCGAGLEKKFDPVQSRQERDNHPERHLRKGNQRNSQN